MKFKALAPWGLFICDPGTTTGIGWGVIKLDEDAESSFAMVKRDLRMTSEVKQFDQGPDTDWRESELEMAKRIATKMMDLRFRWMLAGIPYNRMAWLFEDFILYPKMHSSERSGLAPVRVTHDIHGMLVNVPHMQYFYQTASMAKKKVPNDRLKSSGLWVVGSEHERDVTRHAVTWVASALGHSL